MRALVAAAVALVAAGCGQAVVSAPAASTHAAVAAAQTPAPTATPVPTPVPTPTPTATPTPAPPPTPPPPPAPRTFALGGDGSVSVATNGGSATITVAISGLAAVGHAVHLHSGCNGSSGAHIATIGLVGSSGTVAITVPTRLLGATVIVYPDTSATGRPILCGATA